MTRRGYSGEFLIDESIDFQVIIALLLMMGRLVMKVFLACNRVKTAPRATCPFPLLWMCQHVESRKINGHILPRKLTNFQVRECCLDDF